VLVVDDEPAAREVTARMLSRDGYRVLHAGSGEEALQVAREGRPDIITLDVMMPGMNGWAVLAALKNDAALADIPVVMLTMMDEKSLGYALGATDYLTKPVERDRLTRVLRRIRACGGVGPVLVVEDDPITREMLRRTLEREGWDVVEAENGRIGLDRVAECKPALIILDLMMPEVDGFAFLDALRRTHPNNMPPTVVLTAKELTADDQRRLRGHVENVLKKGDYSLDTLLREVRRLRAQSIC
jgi:CheY-like chemotaxis protein